MSYPDFIEQGGEIWISETQKSTARTHEIDADLLQGMWNQNLDSEVVQRELIMNSDKEMICLGRVTFPSLPNLFKGGGGGFSIDLWLEANSWEPDQIIFSTFGPKNKGIEV